MINNESKQIIKEVIDLYSINSLTQDIIDEGTKKLKRAIELSKVEDNSNPSWVYNSLNIKKYHDLGITGKGIKIAIGDGESNKIPTTDKMTIIGANVNGSNLNNHICESVSVMASKEFGIAPDSEYYFLNFVPKDGDLIGMSQAIRWCADNVDLMVLVGGWKESPFFSNNYADDTTKAMVREALDYAHSKNLKMIISEGNSSNTNVLEYPQCLVNDFIRVGGCNEDFTYASNCTISWFRDVLAYYNNVYMYDANFNTVNNLSGTSFGTPIVGGIVALLLQQNPNLTQDELREYLHDTAYKPEGMDLNYDKYYGYGIAMPSVISDYKGQEEINKEKENNIPIESAELLNEEVTYNSANNRYEITLDKGQSIELKCKCYPENNTDFIRFAVGNKSLLGEIDKDYIVTAKNNTGFNVISGYNCNNEPVVKVKITVK